MSKGGKTDLQKGILLTWRQNPNATNKEIAEACGCSASYVNQIKNRFDGYSEMDAMFDRQDRELEKMFGDDIFGGQGSAMGATPADQPGLAEQWEQTPNNAIGLLVKGFILIIFAYVFWEILNSLII